MVPSELVIELVDGQASSCVDKTQAAGNMAGQVCSCMMGSS